MSSMLMSALSTFHLVTITVCSAYRFQGFIFAVGGSCFLQALNNAAVNEWGTAAYWLGWSFIYYWAHERIGGRL